jgi:hypothetical protein
MQLGISLSHLGASQAAFNAIKLANSMFGTEHDCTLFFRDITVHCTKINAGVMTLSQIWSFRGKLITTSFYDTEFAINAIGPESVLFYCWDLEFLKKEKNYIKNLTILRNEGIVLVARNKDHAEIIYNYCNRRPDLIVDNFNFNIEAMQQNVSEIQCINNN